MLFVKQSTTPEAATVASKKTPDVDVERLPTPAPASDPNDSRRSSQVEKQQDLDPKDIESDVGAWLCVLAAVLFLLSSYGTNFGSIMLFRF